MVSNTSKDLRKEFNDVTLESSNELRDFIEKVLDRMIELEDMINEKQDRKWNE